LISDAVDVDVSAAAGEEDVAGRWRSGEGLRWYNFFRFRGT
jgi:hypothetical protein